MAANFDIERIFTNQPCDEETGKKIERVREKIKELGHEIMEVCPACDDRDAAVDCLRQSTFYIVASLVLDGELEK